MLILIGLIVVPTQASATWSITALDRSTGQMVMALSSCVDVAARDVRKLTAVIVPGKGVAACQASVDQSLGDQTLIAEALRSGTDPAAVMAKLRSGVHFATRQYAIVDMTGRSAFATGPKTPQFASVMTGHVQGTQIFYSVQGNIVAADVVANADKAFRSASGGLLDRAMAALEAGDRAGGDLRCACTAPSNSGGSCDVHSKFAYLLAADDTSAPAASMEPQNLALALYVSPPGLGEDQIQLEAGESLNPVKTLRMRYDAWRLHRGASAKMPNSTQSKLLTRIVAP